MRKPLRRVDISEIPLSTVKSPTVRLPGYLLDTETPTLPNQEIFQAALNLHQLRYQTNVDKIGYGWQSCAGRYYSSASYTTA